jgi:hypothetical protein
MTRVAFVGGIPRSGSTLLEMLLAADPGMVAVGETVHLWQRGVLAGELCSCGVPFTRCDFWCRAGDAAFGGWSADLAHHVLALQRQVDRARYVPLTVAQQPSSHRARVVEYGSHYRRLYEGVLEATGGTMVLDSSKHVSLAAVLSVTEGIDLKVVHLVRDPRAVAYSWTRTVQRPESPDGALMARASPLRIAGRWTVQNGMFSLVAHRAPVLLVSYEQLVRAPEVAVAAIRSFLGLSEDVAAPHQKPTFHSVSGNPMRFSDKPLTVSADEAWRHGLSSLDRRAVEVITAPLALSYRRRTGVP